MYTLKLNAKQLNNAVQTAVAVTEKKQILYYLDDVYFFVKGNKIHVCCGDVNRNYVSVAIDNAERCDDITFSVKKDFLQLIKTMPDDESITFNVDNDNSSIELKTTFGCYESKCSINDSCNTSVFDDVDMGESASFTIDNIKDYKQATKNAMLSIAKKDFLREQLMHVCFYYNNNTLDIVGTDAHILYKSTLCVKNGNNIEKKVSMTPKMLKIINKALNKNSNVDVVIGVEYARFDFNNTTIQIKLPDLQYPNYNGVIPNHTKMFIVNKKQLQNATKRLVAGLTDKYTPRLVCELNTNTIKLYCTSNDSGDRIDYKICENIPIKYEGEPFFVALNPHFLDIMLSTIQTDNVIIKFKEELNPLTLYNETEDSSIRLLMPVR